MLRYNTQLKPLILPEYGRNIHSMIEHCLTIEDREERTKCAYSIVKAMAVLFPELKSGGEYSHKLWDHLAIMSEFKLDIDYPCEVIANDSLRSRPDKVDYLEACSTHRQYGRVIIDMIESAVDMPEGEERTALLTLIGNQMKKIIINSTNDNVDNDKILKDIYELSHHKIRLAENDITLKEYIPVIIPDKKKKKK
ncbi:MAG: DUF4290 domain-containing protein [Paramuribaculum sp.]|nr:DUF4290 domain-containing protein [Paramuribaculum sp.]